jgi:DNA-binding NarL/FixJ family response regulator
MEKKIRILLVDDHNLFLEGLSYILSDKEEIEIIGKVNNGQEAIDSLKNDIPDVIILDISMPILNGIETAKYIVENLPEIKILILSMFSDLGYITDLLKIGVSGYVLKESGQAELMEAINAVYNGDTYFCKKIINMVMESFKNTNSELSGRSAKLSQRERQILELIADDLSTSQIANKLFISLRTVESHKRTIISKLGVKNSKGLIRYLSQRS